MISARPRGAPALSSIEAAVPMPRHRPRRRAFAPHAREKPADVGVLERGVKSQARRQIERDAAAAKIPASR
jgi:hypothetical protein